MDIFVTSRLITIILFTCLVFSWLFFSKEKKARIFFIFFATLYLLYSGIGGALIYISSQYQYYYIAFTLCINIGIYFGLRSVRNKNNKLPYKKSWSDFLTFFINHYAVKIIIIYLSCQLFHLFYPTFKLALLIHPPMPDMKEMLFQRFQGDAPDFPTSLINTVSTIFFPFYLLSLYKYRKNIISLTLLIILPTYIQYCAVGYMGRSSILTAIVMLLGITYFSKPQLGKTLIISCIILIPTLIVFFVQYSIVRAGGIAGNMSSGDAFAILLEQECGYPLHFDDILVLQGNHIGNYLVWLFTMPFPGFVRGGMDAHFAAMFSEYILGISRSVSGFYILLPGVVGESVYLLGKHLFWINGLLYGWLMGAVYRILTRYPQLLCILIYSAINFAYVTNRAGFFGGFPFIGKILVYFFIILWFFKNYTNWKAKYKLELRRN